MKDCIFCSIIDLKIPAHVVYEDEQFVGFLDITPVNPGHVLVIPKQHIESLHDMTNDIAANYLSVVQKVADAVKKACVADGINIMQNNGKAAGQSVFHMHFHIIPRFEDDGFELWKGAQYDGQDADIYCEKIKAEL